MNGLIFAILIIVIILIMSVISRYNKIIKLQNSVKASEAGIDVYLKQRFDLIPNLVECVKGYSKYEKDLLTKIVEERTAYTRNKNLKKASELNNCINRVIAVAENYPDLKANEQFLNLQNSLVKMESQLQAARRIYNMDVQQFNSAIETIPNNIIASIFGFKQKEFFQIEEYQKENIKITGEDL